MLVGELVVSEEKHELPRVKGHLVVVVLESARMEVASREALVILQQGDSTVHLDCHQFEVVWQRALHQILVGGH